jgi:2-oxoglutarate/2-oxoacid ferredoxin oxidoreductase subunit beta
VQLHDGSWIILKALHHESHDVTDRVSAMWMLEESQLKGEFLTGLIYVNSKRRDFVSSQNMVSTTLALLPDDVLRPSKEAVEKIMETI